MSLTEDVRAIALEAGFDLVGVAPADPLPEAEAPMLERLRAGMLEGMGWITEDRVRLSCTPAALLTGARSVIALGKYHRAEPDDAPPLGEPRGRIARYAWGDDYHDVLRARMKRLVDRLETAAGRRPATRLFVDSSPLAERAVAVRAGLGWFGRNTCLLTLHRGSWLLLAEVLTDLELEPGEPLRRDCGRCRLCLDRCPTGALVAPFVLDARRCISYLTIEHRGPIPRELRPLMGDWIFGCDVCQEVCPWNRLARQSPDAAFAPRPGVGPNPALLPLLGMDAGELKGRFRGSPMLRARRRGLLRNVAVALGNSGDPSAVPALVGALEDEEPLVRSHSAWALGRLGGREARPALERSLRREIDEAVRGEVGLALAARAG